MRREKALLSPRLAPLRARLSRLGLRGLRFCSALSLQPLLTPGSLEASLWVQSSYHPAYPTCVWVAQRGFPLSSSQCCPGLRWRFQGNMYLPFPAAPGLLALPGCSLGTMEGRGPGIPELGTAPCRDFPSTLPHPWPSIFPFSCSPTDCPSLFFAELGLLFPDLHRTMGGQNLPHQVQLSRCLGSVPGYAMLPTCYLCPLWYPLPSMKLSPGTVSSVP